MCEAQETAAEFWENAYRNRERTVAGEPNVLLVDAIQGLVPGTALDLAPAIEGWTVVTAASIPHHMVSPEGKAVSRMNNLVHVRHDA